MNRQFISSISPALWIILLLLASCSPVRYIGVEIHNPAALTFPSEMRRLLIVNNAVAQQDVPYESDFRQLADSIKISADSTGYDFCLTLGEVMAGFAGFDDVRLLEDDYRKDQQPSIAPILTQNEVRQLCYEHDVDVVVSLDRLSFQLKETVVLFEMDAYGMVEVEMAGALRVYYPARTNPLTTIVLADTITPASTLILQQNDMHKWDLLFLSDTTNLLRESAKYLAEEARVHFIPYWSEDVRWYYTASDSRWKEASAYAVSERWDKAIEIWQTLYSRTSSWKQKARLSSNLALGMELTGDLTEALKYAEQSHQLLRNHLDADNATVKRHELYVRVLSHRIPEEQKLQLQTN